MNKQDTCTKYNATPLPKSISDYFAIVWKGGPGISTVINVEIMSLDFNKPAKQNVLKLYIP